MLPNVFFSLLARNKFEQRHARHLAQGESLSDLIEKQKQRLLQVFPHAELVAVQDLSSGYRQRENEFIFLLEVTQGDATVPAVVKLGEEARLEREFEAWESCKPGGLKHDLVLMNLEAIRDRKGRLIGIAYGNAEQLIGVDQTMHLEEAMMGAVLHGSPSIESVADVIFQLYERLGLLFYRHSYCTSADLTLKPKRRKLPQEQAGSKKAIRKQAAVKDQHSLEEIDPHIVEKSTAMEQEFHRCICASCFDYQRFERTSIQQFVLPIQPPCWAESSMTHRVTCLLCYVGELMVICMAAMCWLGKFMNGCCGLPSMTTVTWD